jgi:uncharacterized SAM-binding protein YcdF (DUF218 family)
MISSAARRRILTNSQRGGIFFRMVFLLFLLFCLFVLYLVRYPILRFAGNFWVVSDAPQHSDAIVILGDDNYEADRAARAAELYRAGWAPRIVASGRYLRPYAGIAELMEHDLTDRGVPRNAVVRFAHRASDTREEAAALAPFLAQHGWKKILVVTSTYHTRRSRFIFERTLPAGFELRVIAAHDTEYDPDSWWRTRQGLKRFLHESLGMAAALWEMRHSNVHATS